MYLFSLDCLIDFRIVYFESYLFCILFLNIFCKAQLNIFIDTERDKSYFIIYFFIINN